MAKKDKSKSKDNKNKENKKSIINSEAFPGILLLATTILALILANTQLDKFYNYIL